MEIIQEPKTEEEILAAAAKEATGKEILEDINEKGDHCVDHLCGCS